MVLTRLSHAGEVCPLGDVQCYGCRSGNSYTGAHNTDQSMAKPDDGEPLNTRPSLQSLPTELIEKVLGFLSYREVGEMRLISRRFDSICGTMLNKTFHRLQNQTLQRFQAIKAQMPRRESLRRKHPLARECDIIETLHMRLTLLQMSFGKHIERKHCYFFPGEILDEVYRILSYIKGSPNLGRAYKVTDELFDLSTMAMEYFKEYLEPRLPEITYFGPDFLDFSSLPSSPGPSSTSTASTSSMVGSSISEMVGDFGEDMDTSTATLKKRVKKLSKGMKRNNSQLCQVKKELKACKNKVGDQHKQLIDYSSRLDEYDKKFDESARKFSTLLQELNKCKTELQYWRSKAPAIPQVCSNCRADLGMSDDTNPPLLPDLLELESPAELLERLGPGPLPLPGSGPPADDDQPGPSTSSQCSDEDAMPPPPVPSPPLSLSPPSSPSAAASSLSSSSISRPMLTKMLPPSTIPELAKLKNKVETRGARRKHMLEESSEAPECKKGRKVKGTWRKKVKL